MSKVFRINAFWLYSKIVISGVLGLLSTRFLVQNLAPSDFGLYVVIGSVVVVMNFVNSVMVTTSYRFLAYELGSGDTRGVNEVFNLSILIHVSLSIFLFVVSEIVGMWYVENFLAVDASRYTDLPLLLRLSVLSALLNIVCVPYQGLLIAVENFAASSIIEILKWSLLLLAAVFMGVFGADNLLSYFLLVFVIHLLIAACYIVYTNKTLKEYTLLNSGFNTNRLKEMLSFSGWTSLGAAAYVGRDTGSQLIINSFYGTVINGSFGIATSLNNFIRVFANGFGQVAVPSIVKTESQGNTVAMLNMVSVVSRYSFFIYVLCSLPFMLETELFIRTWLGSVPDLSLVFVRLLILNGLISSVLSSVPTAVQATGKIKWFQIILSGLSLMGLPISIALFSFGASPEYLLWVYILISILNSLLNLLLVRKIINVSTRPLIDGVIKPALFVILLISPLVLIRMLNLVSVNYSLWFSCFVYLMCVVVVYYKGTNKREKELLVNYVVKIFRH